MLRWKICWDASWRGPSLPYLFSVVATGIEPDTLLANLDVARKWPVRSGPRPYTSGQPDAILSRYLWRRGARTGPRALPWGKRQRTCFFEPEKQPNAPACGG